MTPAHTLSFFLRLLCFLFFFHLPKWRIYLYYTQYIEHANHQTVQLSVCCLWAVCIPLEINRAPQTLSDTQL